MILNIVLAVLIGMCKITLNYNIASYYYNSTVQQHFVVIFKTMCNLGYYLFPAIFFCLSLGQYLFPLMNQMRNSSSFYFTL